MNRRGVAILAALASATPAGVATASAALGGAQGAASHTVVLKAVRFHPGTLDINRGDSVTWLWRDGNERHNVTFHGTHSRTMSHGSFTVRFTHSGTFAYICTIHVKEGMKGKVIVR